MVNEKGILTVYNIDRNLKEDIIDISVSNGNVFILTEKNIMSNIKYPNYKAC